MRLFISAGIFGLLYCIAHVSAQPNKDLYELQERCSRLAKQTFDREYSPPVLDTADAQTVFNYESHYSARLNKCFFLEIAVSNEKANSTSSKIMSLFDLTKNNKYGTFVSGAPPPPCPTRAELQDAN